MRSSRSRHDRGQRAGSTSVHKVGGLDRAAYARLRPAVNPGFRRLTLRASHAPGTPCARCPATLPAGGAPRGTGARTIARPVANIKSTAEGVFPAQKTPRVRRMCSASGWHPRSALGTRGYRRARRAACARKMLHVSSDQRRSRHRRTRWHRLAPDGTPGHSWISPGRYDMGRRPS